MKDEAMRSYLNELEKAASGLFSHCSEEELATIRPLIRLRVFSPGEVVVRAGEPFPIVGSIQEGLALVRTPDTANRASVFAFLMPTDLIGSPDAKPARYDIVAAGELRVSCMDLVDFMPLIRSMPDVAMTAVERALDRLELIEAWVVRAHQLDAKGRVTSLLALMALRQIQAGLAQIDAPVTMKIPVSREVIGNLLGLGLHTVSRMIGDLKTEGLISFEDPHLVTVPDLFRLLRTLGCEPDTVEGRRSPQISAPF